MSEATAGRPPLTSNDTLDHPELVGKLTGNGSARLQADLSAVGIASEDHQTDHGNAASFSVDEDEIEDYDAISVNPDTIIGGSQAVSAGDRRASLMDGLGPMNGKSNDLGRRKSIQVRLEKTDKKGRYVLTADDPEIRDILRQGIAREEAAAADANSRPRTRIRDLVFTRQFTTFDRQNPLSSESPFHGFFVLFWLSMAGMFLKVAASNWRNYGSILGNNEILSIMFSKDVVVLGASDVVMMCASSFGLVLHKAILAGYLTWNRSGWIIQNIWQTFFLFSVIGWTVYRDWPWTHTIFLVIHTLAFLMKQHSYAFYNGHLSNIYRRRVMLGRKLKQLEDMQPAGSTPTSPVTATSSAIPSANSTVQRKGQSNRPPILRTATNLSMETSDVAKVASAIDSEEPFDVDQKQAFERVIRAEMETLDKELRGKCTSTDNAYPKNLNISNFADWCCLPTLVYELEYPRQEHINWWYVAEKTAATFGTIGVMMVISQAYIYPPVAETVRMREAGMSLQERWQELPWIVSDMLFPLLLEQLLTWYVIWVSDNVSSYKVPRLTCAVGMRPERSSRVDSLCRQRILRRLVE